MDYMAAPTSSSLVLHLQDGYSIPSACIPNKELYDSHNNIHITRYTTHISHEFNISLH